VRAAVRCPTCGPLDYNEVVTDPETTAEFCALCGADLADQPWCPDCEQHHDAECPYEVLEVAEGRHVG